MNRSIWKVVKEAQFVPTHEVNGVVVNKDNADDWTKEEKRKGAMQFEI